MLGGSLFKSELMTKSRFFIPPEAAYNCIAELGEIGWCLLKFHVTISLIPLVRLRSVH